MSTSQLNLRACSGRSASEWMLRVCIMVQEKKKYRDDGLVKLSGPKTAGKQSCSRKWTNAKTKPIKEYVDLLHG